MRPEETRSCTVSGGICRSCSVRAARSFRTGSNAAAWRSNSTLVTDVSPTNNDTAVLLISYALLPARGMCLLAIEVERAHDRHIGVTEQDGWLCAGVNVLVEGPARHAEHVLVLPVEPLAIYDRVALSFDDVERRTGGVAVRLGVLARVQELYVATDCGHGRTAGHRVGVLHDHPVEGAGRALGC